MFFHYALIVLIGWLAGVASGMFGIGGGIIIVPALILLANFSIVQANGTSLAALLLPVGLPAVLAYHHQKLVHWKAAFSLAGGLLIGVVGGALIALALPQDILKRLYGLFLLYMAWRFIDPQALWRDFQRRRRAQPNNDPPPAPLDGSTKPISILWMIGLGVLAGISSGMFGIGGGNIIVPILVAFLGFDQKLAIGTSLAALLLPVGLPGVLLYGRAGQLDWQVAFPLALGLLAGVLVGARITISLPSYTIKRIYGVFLFIMGLRFLFG